MQAFYRKWRWWTKWLTPSRCKLTTLKLSSPQPALFVFVKFCATYTGRALTTVNSMCWSGRYSPHLGHPHGTVLSLVNPAAFFSRLRRQYTFIVTTNSCDLGRHGRTVNASDILLLKFTLMIEEARRLQSFSSILFPWMWRKGEAEQDNHAI